MHAKVLVLIVLFAFFAMAAASNPDTWNACKDKQDFECPTCCRDTFGSGWTGAGAAGMPEYQCVCFQDARKIRTLQGDDSA